MYAESMHGCGDAKPLLGSILEAWALSDRHPTCLGCVQRHQHAIQHVLRVTGAGTHRMAGNCGKALSWSFGHVEVGSSASFWLVGAHGHAPSWLRWCQSMWLDGTGQIGCQMRTRGAVWLWVALAAPEGPGDVPQWVGTPLCWCLISGDMGHTLEV